MDDIIKVFETTSHQHWYEKEPFLTLFSVLGIFVPIPSRDEPSTPLSFKVFGQWFGFVFCLGKVPLGWIIILTALIISRL